MSEYPVEISSKCWEEIELYLEEIYQAHPFKRIKKDGKYLGYEGFMDNYDLTVKDLGSRVEISLVVENGEVAYQAIFDKHEGLEEVTHARQ